MGMAEHNLKEKEGPLLEDDLGGSAETAERSSMVQDFKDRLNGDQHRYYDQDNLSNINESKLGTITTGSVHSLDDALHLTPSTLQQKQDATFQYFIKSLGILYAMFLFISSTLIFFLYPIDHGERYSITIILYIILSGLIITSILLFDIIRHLNKLKKEEKEGEVSENEDLNSGVQGDFSEDGRTAAVLRRATSFKRSEIPHDYCFVTGRHAGNTYLKFGTAAFAIGHLVHSSFLVMIQISFMKKSSHCIDIPQHFADVLYPVYSFLQLVFIFKYCNVIILKYKPVATLLILHIIAGNLCLWSLAVSRETELALAAYRWSNMNETTIAANDDECRLSAVIINIFQLYSPYLMPFSVEFNISIVAFFYTILSNIGHCHCKKNESEQHSPLTPQRSNFRNSQGNAHTLSITVNCHRSSRGVFTGVVVIVLLVGTVLLGFLFGNLDVELETVGYTITDSTKLAFHLMMLIAVVVAYIKMRRLDVNQHPTPLLDDVLLYICVPAFFMETLFTVIATVNLLNVVKLLDTIIMSVQMVIQTAFIIDGLRRCSNSRKLRRTKPGRELVLFLLMMNVAMWVLFTFSYKSPQSKDERYQYFGKEFWTKVGHLTAPLIMFYRFHSSACIAEMWSYAYKPGIHEE